ncbi:MAG: hypothetical protein Q7I99_02655 [Acholeplasmataceae bacterium]|nr:hypothetical protein [Acholeplasmataceae bacterium]
MDALTIPWAFYMKYEKSKKQMTIFFSKRMKQLMELSLDSMILSEDDLKEFVHKYDQRKLDYFSNQKITGPFNTMMRFKTTHGKSYLRTLAICQIDQHGFHCITIEDMFLHKMNQLLASTKMDIKQVKIEIEELDKIIEVESEFQINKFKSHLTTILNKASN